MCELGVFWELQDNASGRPDCAKTRNQSALGVGFLASIIIDQRMSKNLIEPGNDPIHIFDGMKMGQCFDEALLQEVFGERGIATS